MIYGVDVSAYQPNFDFAAAARDGIDFAFIKSTEGTNWRSPNYARQVRDARAAGLLVAAYHYVRGSDVAGQLANIRAMVSTDTPVILDVEEGAGSIASIRALNKAVNDAGYRTPLIYVPKWYWQGHMGSPDLSGLPPNWLSWYPDYVVRRKETGVAKIPASVWNGFGGIPIAIVQFTSSLAVANYPNGSIDGNAYRGTRDQLAALLGGTTAGEDDFLMGLAQWQQEKIFERVLAMSAGVEGENFNGRQFEHEEARHYALASKLDAMAAVLQQIAQEDDRVALDDAQLATLQTSVRELVSTEVDEIQAELEARLGAMAEQLGSKLGQDKATVLEALREFYRPAVDAPGQDQPSA